MLRRSRSCDAGDECFTAECAGDAILQTMIMMNFDAVMGWPLSRPALWLLLQPIGVPQKIINLMAALYTDSSRCVRVNEEPSDFFTFFTGVRQGCVLAPDSFDTAMDWILRHTLPRSVPGISIGLDYFTDLDYADDVALLVELLDLLEPALLNFSDEASKLGLRVNWKKTVRKVRHCSIYQFTYLGSTTDSSGKSEPDICRRITIAKSAMQQT